MVLQHQSDPEPGRRTCYGFEEGTLRHRRGIGVVELLGEQDRRAVCGRLCHGNSDLGREVMAAIAERSHAAIYPFRLKVPRDRGSSWLSGDRARSRAECCSGSSQLDPPNASSACTVRFNTFNFQCHLISRSALRISTHMDSTRATTGRWQRGRCWRERIHPPSAPPQLPNLPRDRNSIGTRCAACPWRTTWRNGYRERRLDTRLGTLQRTPKPPGAQESPRSADSGALSLRNRWFVDSPLEGSGFKLSVPRGTFEASELGLIDRRMPDFGVPRDLPLGMIEGSARSRVIGTVDRALQERGIAQKPD
jgi:hypothetical protein